MRALLALITFNGLSMVIWTCVGACRLVHEKARVLGGQRAMALSALLLSLVGVLALWLGNWPLLGIAVAILSCCLVLAGGRMLRQRTAHRAASQAGAEISSEVADDAGAPRRITIDEVAVLVAAHNEEENIPICLDAVSKLVPAQNIFVGSDGSTDNTVAIAKERGCQVLDIQPNGGKARALKAVIDHFAICERYRAVLILDADAKIDEHYLEHALPLFDDPAVAAVAGHAIPKWYPHWLPRSAMFFIAYRIRLYRITQALLRYGQTWKYSNVNFIVPGFASMYRCSVLPKMDIAAPGLIIEDFNMTFELHHKKLGQIAYTPHVRCISQEAHNFRDYVKQVRRWHLGFWQTVRRHGLWASFFWLSLGIFAVEILLQSLAFLLLPFLLGWFLFQPGEPITVFLPQLGTTELSVADVAIGVFVADYALTLLVAGIERKPMLLLYGLGFSLLRWIDSFLFLYTLPLAFIEKSDGRWVSPARI